MSTTLIFWLSTYVYLFLIAAVLHYGMLLNLFNRHGTSKPSLLWKALLSAAAGIFAWIIFKFLLRGYFIGLIGFVTSQDVTRLVPTFAMVQALLTPLFAILGIVVFLFVSLWGQYASSDWKANMILVTLASFSTIIATALMFLGVLIP